MTLRVRAHLGAHPFKLPPANVLEVLALGPGGGGFVEVYRNLVALPDLGADMARDRDAVLKRHSLDGNERNHIGGADARMGSLMLVEVDQLRGLARAANRRLGDGIPVSDQG